MISQNSQLYIVQPWALCKAVGMTMHGTPQKIFSKKPWKTGLRHSVTAVMNLRHLNLLDSFFNPIFAPECFVVLSSSLSTHTKHLSAPSSFHIPTPWKAELHHLPALSTGLDPSTSPSCLLINFAGKRGCCSHNQLFWAFMMRLINLFSTEQLRLVKSSLIFFFLIKITTFNWSVQILFAW